MTIKLIIGNKAYSSWSMRGWLAAKQSGLHIDEVVVPLFDDNWEARKKEADLVPSAGKVPTLWDGETVVWESLAIIDYLGDKVGRDRYWPKDEVARGMARAMSAEMHSSYTSLRRECPMNTRATFTNVSISAETKRETESKGEKWLRTERHYGKVQRSFSLGQDVDSLTAKAKYDQGVLNLVLPKKVGALSKQITVQ